MPTIESTPALRKRRRGISLKALECTGSLLGLLGAGLLALHNAASGYGFAWFLVSNVCWIGAALHTKNLPLLLMQLGFTATSLFGLWNWLRIA